MGGIEGTGGNHGRRDGRLPAHPPVLVIADLAPLERTDTGAQHDHLLLRHQQQFLRQHQRAAALAILAASAAGLGGFLLAQLGWRGAFIALGLAGMPIALMLLFGVREPRRGGGDGIGDDGQGLGVDGHGVTPVGALPRLIGGAV